MKELVKVGYCVAYDWHLLKYSIPLIYKHADFICLSLDKDRISWSGNKYNFDESEFKRLIDSIDSHKKILLLEEDYHKAGLTPMQNEVHQRNRIAQHLGDGGWHIQLDCDEYFLHFEKFIEYLRNLSRKKTHRANVSCQWVVLYKQLSDGFLYVDPINKNNIELIQIATREASYEYGRRNGNFNLITNFKLLHQSWARPYQDIREKIHNWGHSNDFEKDRYLEFWESLSRNNFTKAFNFHHLKPETWPALKFMEAKSMEELIANDNLQKFPSFSKTDLFFKNSKFFSRIRKLKSHSYQLWNP